MARSPGSRELLGHPGRAASARPPPIEAAACPAAASLFHSGFSAASGWHLVEVGRHDDLTGEKPEPFGPGTVGHSERYNLREWAARLGDDEGFSLRNALDQPRQMCFSLMNIYNFHKSRTDSLPTNLN